MPPSLRERLGEDGTFGLLEMMHVYGRQWSDQVLSLAVERFERRLAEEMGKVRAEIANTRVELLKWSFLFWVGQVAAMAGLLAFMLRGVIR